MIDIHFLSADWYISVLGWLSRVVTVLGELVGGGHCSAMTILSTPVNSEAGNQRSCRIV